MGSHVLQELQQKTNIFYGNNACNQGRISYCHRYYSNPYYYYPHSLHHLIHSCYYCWVCYHHLVIFHVNLILIIVSFSISSKQFCQNILLVLTNQPTTKSSINHISTKQNSLSYLFALAFLKISCQYENTPAFAVSVNIRVISPASTI